jgi:4-diphosphocytidyl-2-C-methyl-D-erythritol kinase
MLAPSDDLIRRAASLLREVTGTALGARITLQKSIPTAGGLGGGSSDAAATLFALNEIWQTGLNTEKLTRLAAQLGSDVPSFFSAAPALVSGRGEIVQAIPAQPSLWVVLVAPPWSIPTKTATLFRALTPNDFSDGSQIGKIAATLSTGTANELEPTNTFERVIDQAFPEWSTTRASLERASGAPFWLTGAGPCLYALLPNEQVAQDVLERINPLSLPALVSQLVDGPLRVDP